MIKRTVEISREAVHLGLRHKQLTFKRDGEIVHSIPCEEIGMVVVDHPGTTYTHAALRHLAESNAAVVICGVNHLPAAILLPIADHSEVVWRLQEQIAAPKPVCKRLWRQIVCAKIDAQAAVLPDSCGGRQRLKALISHVKSGDTSNVEARAAKIYWQYWYPEVEFRRDPDRGGLNAQLNYGYAVLRAAIARAIVSAGLTPAIGLHHRNRANPFCLADDLIEPFRPMVDERVRELHRQGYDSLSQECKGELLKLLTQQTTLGGEKGPWMVQLHRMLGSLVRCLRKEQTALEIPVPCE
ncbi:type II CRISPR-associated endonuclease Cas1 [Blastopirellula retiformator]|uniref:CRISPR-associated endonuclease Cas1 n=1 Tax=Blastopirellula retiformator TaxID=2527970 RepID=A0A5C5UWY2_9BACT|nr:type II CRISPR-associated endonuclease Cas1 [Blastopirellula retiformator]TWT30067.1 CRISPR-associated endonuclease Cas1 [Blastopirellula retiformator]